MKQNGERGSVLVLLLVVLILGVIFFVTGFLIGKQKVSLLNQENNLNNISKKANNQIIKDSSSKDKCTYYGYIFNKDDYLPKYTVEKGDTLGSLAKKYLGNTERYTEIIELNKDRYQNLYINSFLEIGWILYIPPSFSFPTQRLAGYSGEIIETTSDFIVMEYYDRSVKDAHPVMRLKRDVRTKYFEKNNYNTGDCIGVLVDSACTGEICNLVAVAPEESYKAYFTMPLEIKK